MSEVSDEKTTGLIYHVLDATRQTQYIKIGFTTNLRDRLTALAGITASGQMPLVLALEEGTVALERQRHHQFALMRSHGEWFIYTEEIHKFLGEMEHPFGYLLDRPHLWPASGGWGPLGPAAKGQRDYAPDHHALFLADMALRRRFADELVEPDTQEPESTISASTDPL